MLAHLERRTTDSAAAPAFQPAAVYADAARHEREVATLFRRWPVAIGHVSQLARPGDFLTHDATGVPLLVVRGDDGALAAFLNVCRHRGTRVEPAACGARKAFTCPYHAWSYGRDGSLLHVPHEHGFALDGARRGLEPVAVAEIAGLVFVVPSPGATLPADFLGALAADLDGFGFPASQVYAPTTITRPLDWKLAIDIFLEAYHLRPLHRDSIYPMFFDNVALVDPHGPHLRNVFPKRTLRELPDRDPATWRLREHANILYHLFPNTLVLIEPDHAAVLHLWPSGPGRTLLTAYTLIPERATTDKAVRYWDRNNAILYGAIEEDFAMGESIQRGVSAHADLTYVFGAFEHALTHFHARVREACLPQGATCPLGKQT